MKTLKFDLILAFLIITVFAYAKQIDNVKNNVSYQSNDSLRVIKFYELAKDFEQKKGRHKCYKELFTRHKFIQKN